jgi:BMFP domain-containing protein YqiC
MTSTQSRFFDDLAKLMTNAAGAAQGARREFDTIVQGQLERVLNNMQLVKRDEFEAVKAMAQKAREENDALVQRLAKLEAKLATATESASDTRAD